MVFVIRSGDADHNFDVASRCNRHVICNTSLPRTDTEDGKKEGRGMGRGIPRGPSVSRNVELTTLVPLCYLGLPVTQRLD